jgi:transcriptional regulator with XRE-family HTH domain
VPKRQYQKELGEAIQALRKERGLKQQDLAKAAGVSVAQVSNVESGQFWPSVQTLIAFAEKLGVGVSDIFAFELGPDDRVRAAERAKLLALTNRLSHEELTWAIEVLMAAVKRPAQAPSKPRGRSKKD